jgi:phosphatidate cytidylyltransferase
LLVVSYAGLLPSFLLQLRWLDGGLGSVALALAIFVPKCGDIGAYAMGRLLGKHPMTPLLSPKKTWEGAAGGLAASVLAALVLNLISTFVSGKEPLLAWPSAVLFGVVIGILAMLGDLAESLLKRDCGRKDASTLIPGFGGVLDVLDSVVFSAPVAYLWIAVGSQLC